MDAASYQEQVARARARITEITPEALEMRGGGLLVDVREPNEHATGVIHGALLIPMAQVPAELPPLLAETTGTVVLYCAVGARSALAAFALQEQGWNNVASLAGGIAAWQSAGRPVVAASGLGAEQLDRYSRHLVLPEVGSAGQQRLLDSKVMVVGAGGLGSPAALYLAAAGVGTLGIVDDDRVEVSNLQRQVIHDAARIGRPKALSAADSIAALNSDVDVRTHAARLEASNVLDVLGGYDVVIDASDNFPTRYLVNDASLHLGVPVVHASVHRFEGQLSVFVPYRGPCYRCLFPEPPPPHLAPSCAEAGVLGVLPGVVGSLQATEALKLLLGVGEPLLGRLLTYDALRQEFLTFRLERNPNCPACADRPPRLIDYDETCTPSAQPGGEAARADGPGHG